MMHGYIKIKFGSDPLVGAKMTTGATCLDTKREECEHVDTYELP